MLDTYNGPWNNSDTFKRSSLGARELDIVFICSLFILVFLGLQKSLGTLSVKIISKYTIQICRLQAFGVDFKMTCLDPCKDKIIEIAVRVFSEQMWHKSWSNVELQ